MIEMRQSAYNKVFELLEEAEKNNKRNKSILDELYDCMEECYEQEVDDEHEMQKNNEKMDYRRGMRSGMRHYDIYSHDMRGGLRRHNYDRYSY